MERSLSVTYRPLSDLLPYPQNARTHTPEQIDQIAASITEFGFVNPALIDEKNSLIAGHGRLLAAKKLGLAQIPIIQLDGLTASQKRALRLADNKIAANSGWDSDMLRVELGDLKMDGFDLSITGFSDAELANFLAPPVPDRDPDDIPETPTTPVTQPGDLWLLGRHRLLCGDATSQEDVARLMANKQATLCFTSPPYAKQRAYQGDMPDWDTLMQGMAQALPLTTSGQLLVNLGLVHRDNEWLPYWDQWLNWMKAQGWRRFGWYVWDQGAGLPGDWAGRLAPAHEFIFHFNRQAKQPNKTKDKLQSSIETDYSRTTILRKGGDKKPGTADKKHRINCPELTTQPTKVPDSVIRVSRRQAPLGDGLDHPAIFPVALAQEVIEAYSSPEDIVFEPFSGSGSSIIAAGQVARICYAMEILPAYVDVAIQRWQRHWGQKAYLESTNMTYDEISEQRANPLKQDGNMEHGISVA